MKDIFSDFENSGNSTKYVGLTSAVVKSIIVDSKVTNDGSKRFDINLEYSKSNDDLSLKTKISFWSKPEYEVSRNGKVRYIDSKGRFLDSWLENDINDYRTQQKILTSSLVNPRPSYPNEKIFADFVRILIGYKNSSELDLLDNGNNSGFSIPKMYRGEDEFLDKLNNILSKSDKHIGVMLGINDAGYTDVYKYKFFYSSAFNKEESLEKVIEQYASISQKYYKQIEYSLNDKAEKLNKQVSNLTSEEIYDVMQYRKESGIYYAGKITEFSDNLDSNLIIDFKAIRDSVITNLIPSDSTNNQNYFF